MVSTSTIQKAMGLAERLKYEPNTVAVILRSGNTQLL